MPAEATKQYTMNKLARMQYKMIQTKIDTGIPLTPLESALSRMHKPKTHTSARDTIKEQQTAARQEAVQTKRGRPKANAAAAKSAAANPAQQVITTKSLPGATTDPMQQVVTGAQPRSP